MKIALQYVHDLGGTTQAVQLPISDWEKILNRLKKYEQSLRLKSDLKIALEEVKALKKDKKNKETLSQFLHEL